MPKILSRSDLTSVTKPEDFQRHGSQAISEIVDTVNGGLEFDKNLATEHVTVTFTAANTDTAVSHSLEKTGVHYLKAKSSVDCSIYDGQSVSTKKVIYLRSTQPATVVLVLY